MRDWQNIDARENPDTFINYLENAQENGQFRQLREKICNLLTPLAGGTGVDVGCGLGLATYELAQHGLKVTGVDLSQTIVNKASKRYPDLNFRVGNMCNLPFQDDTLDFYRTERVCIHLPKQQVGAALAEAYRVLKPGGKIVLAEPDLATIVFTCSEANWNAERTVVTALVDATPNGRAGSFLGGQLCEAGFTDISVEGYTLVLTEPDLAWAMALDVPFEFAFDSGRLTKAQLQELRRDMDEYGQRNTFQFSCTFFIISGHR